MKGGWLVRPIVCPENGTESYRLSLARRGSGRHLHLGIRSLGASLVALVVGDQANHGFGLFLSIRLLAKLLDPIAMKELRQK